jgi:dihydrofolate reductase
MWPCRVPIAQASGRFLLLDCVRVLPPTAKQAVVAKLVISANVTLDGVVQDPDGRERFARGGWFGRHGGSDLDAWARLEADEAEDAAGLLLGRRSDEWFAARWTTRSGEWADRLNVASSTADSPAWSNATLLRGDVVDAVATLKRDSTGELIVYASGQLVRLLIEHDLVDELRLVVFPVLLGGGDRLFGETAKEKPLRLLGSRAVGDGLTLLVYQVLHS